MSRKRKPYDGTSKVKRGRDIAQKHRQTGAGKRARKKIRADREQSGRSIRPTEEGT